MTATPYPGANKCQTNCPEPPIGHYSPYLCALCVCAPDRFGMSGLDWSSLPTAALVRVLQLQISSIDGIGEWSTSTVPGLSKLTKLQRLHMSNCNILEPSVLQSIGPNQLQHLSLRDIDWRKHASDCNFGVPQLPINTVSPWFSQQQELTHLALSDVATMPAKGPDARALLSSSKLCHAHLNIEVCQWSGVFTTDQQLPHLTNLYIRLHDCQQAPDLTVLVHSCPALPALGITHWWECTHEPGNLATVDPLLYLQHLTALKLAFCDDTATPALAQMTRLVSLELSRPCDITDTGLLRLTALKWLTQLEVWQSSPGAALTLSNGQRLDSLTNQAAWDEPPDVWAHLLQCCNRSPACQAVLAASAVD